MYTELKSDSVAAVEQFLARLLEQPHPVQISINHVGDLIVAEATIVTEDEPIVTS